MAQNYNENIYQSNHIIKTDVQHMERNFICLKSAFSGASTPANASTGMLWYDTTNKLQKFRNYSNNAWLGLLPLDTTQKIWIYRNDAVSGLVVDTSVTDKVLGVRATSGSYNRTPGTSMSSWTDFSHTHTRGSFVVNTRHRHSCVYNSSGGVFSHASSWDSGSYTNYQGSTAQAVSGSSASGDSANWRPQAAVGTLQKIDP